MLRKIGIAVVAVLVVAALVVIRFDLPATEVDAQYRTPDSHFATLASGTRLHYWDQGNLNGPVLVLLHGSYDCANSWEDWAPHLDHDFHLIVPDLPAHGLTGKTAENDYTIETMVSTVHDLLAKLGIARVHMAGNSMGGNVSWRYALTYPEQVDRLVLIDSAGYPDLESVSPPANNPLMRILLLYGNPKFLLTSGFERAIEDDRIVTTQRIERWNAFVRRAGSREAHRKRGEQRAMGSQPFTRIAEIKQPTLILWGERDALIPVEHAHKFERDLKNRQLIIYPKIGHMPQLELPERSASDARAFLLASAPSQPTAGPAQPTAAVAPN